MRSRRERTLAICGLVPASCRSVNVRCACAHPCLYSRDVSEDTVMRIRTLVNPWLAGVALAMGIAAVAFGQTRILGEAKDRQPGYGEIENFTIVSYSDLNGWDEAAEFRVSR